MAGPVQFGPRLERAPSAMQPLQVGPDARLHGRTEALNRELHDRMQDHTAWQTQAELLRSVPGVGPVVAELPEPGRLNGRETRPWSAWSP